MYVPLANLEVLKKQGLNPQNLFHSFILFQKINLILSTFLCKILWKRCSASGESMFSDTLNFPCLFLPEKNLFFFFALASAVSFFLLSTGCCSQKCVTVQYFGNFSCICTLQLFCASERWNNYQLPFTYAISICLIVRATKHR